MLNQNAHFLSKKQLREHVNKLNGCDENPLSTEWETIILNTFSKIGCVRYEQSFGGNKHPDLSFQSNDTSNISFLADITTVSDAGYEKDSPVKPFIDETKRILGKNGIKLGGVNCEIDSIKGKRSMLAKIPATGQFHSFFKSSDFKGFIAKIKKDPTSQQSMSFVSENVEIKFYYNPQGKYFSVRYPSYNTAHSLTNNPIYNALKSKAEQLKKSNYKGITAIFLCDGGCNLLTSQLHDWQSYNLDKIITEFFRQYSSIHFILSFTVKETASIFSRIGQKKYIEPKPFLNPVFEMPGKLPDILNKFIEYLSVPVNTIVNAAHRVSNGFEKQGNSFYGGSTVTNKSIKISSRGLLELLSERIELNKFLQDHQFAPTANRPDNRNHFALRLNEGKLISGVKLEKNSHNDDDWIIFEFGESDPSISIYKVPIE